MSKMTLNDIEQVVKKARKGRINPITIKGKEYYCFPRLNDVRVMEEGITVPAGSFINAALDLYIPADCGEDNAKNDME